ncbi:hypothetical protein Ae406Ps2_6014 [Pseudonocardia sp. Ae406_Ps2]|nr:hypothetical protein Ae406Ps2_6014 [Pseudonocardia sp. Ae406_Ps2]OLM09525.1 hypothetical protein Ae706Ps2_5987c [Pseudonocardia sp. Ae706_Ps2]OLM09528.1 hypothetical protein Ae706Ps2_5990c [Pseudonocardia sp. Ae706_Ps2]OLM27865.1 hypothetical protein Ae717Ps2_7083 [Pseudonocardia sp. Ae717_Ps2]
MVINWLIECIRHPTQLTEVLIVHESWIDPPETIFVHEHDGE